MKICESYDGILMGEKEDLLYTTMKDCKEYNKYDIMIKVPCTEPCNFISYTELNMWRKNYQLKYVTSLSHLHIVTLLLGIILEFTYIFSGRFLHIKKFSHLAMYRISITCALLVMMLHSGLLTYSMEKVPGPGPCLSGHFT